MENFTDMVKDMYNCHHCLDISSPNPWHAGDFDIWTHTMMVLKQVQDLYKNLNITFDYNVLLLSALCHDLGKPVARSIDADVKKVRFKGHEGISFFKSIKVLDKLLQEGIIDQKTKETVLKVIALHSSIFDTISSGEIDVDSLINRYTKNKELFDLVAKMSEADSNGRFCIDPDNRRANFSSNHSEIDLIKSRLEADSKEYKTLDDCDAKLTVLIGPPCSGKDYYIMNKMSPEEDSVIISRDSVLMEFGQRMGLGTEYSEIWKNLTDDYQKEIDKILLMQYNDSIKERKNIIINLTNMSRKSRQKWLNNPLLNKANYFKQAIVFAVDYDTLFQRNNKRFEMTGKFIPDYVMCNMMSAFAFPMYNEFDSVKVVYEAD
jgi:predicted kinase